MSSVDSGDSQFLDPLHERVSSIVCIDGSEFGLDRSGGLQLFLIVAIKIQDSRQPHGCMGINKTRSCHRCFKKAISFRDVYFAQQANSLDLPIF